MLSPNLYDVRTYDGKFTHELVIMPKYCKRCGECIATIEYILTVTYADMCLECWQDVEKYSYESYQDFAPHINWDMYFFEETTQLSIMYGYIMDRQYT